MVLIPKIPEADKFELFKPIALANLILKLITKVIADMLAKVAPCIMSKHQRGFI